MKLITTVPLPKITSQIDYNSRVILLGSCFTENIGTQLSRYGFHTVINPFGIIFNPVSIAALVQKSVEDTPFLPEDIDGTFSYWAHSVLNGSNAGQTLEQLNTARTHLKESILNASHVIITLGSAWVYRHVERDMIVANCHKQPQRYFNKELLSSQEIQTALLNISNGIERLNPGAQLIFTLSPVRHFKDGAVQNTRSKARLHDGIQHLVDQQKGLYFPSYEIVMDEMREYRFYGNDLLHLNELGIEYVWSRFRESVIDKNTLPIQKLVLKYRALASHRPTDVVSHSKQLKKLKEELLELYPEIQLS